MPKKIKKSPALTKKLKVGKKILKKSKSLLKKRKRQLIEQKKILAQMMQEDEGKGLENINRSVKINTYEMARGIKDFKQLEEFIDLYIPALTAADIAVLATQHAKDKWNTIQILGDLEKHPSIFVLLDRIEKTKGGAIKVFNDYKNNKINPLTEFIKDTSYKIPSTIGTFQNHVSKFLNHFGLKRDKSGKFSYERAAAALARRKKRESKPPKHKSINYKDYEKTALGWRKKIN